MNPRLNELLDQLPEADYHRLLPHLRLTSLRTGSQLYAPGDQIDKLYFPVSAALAVATLTPAVAASEIGPVKVLMPLVLLAPMVDAPPPELMAA